MRHSVPSEHAGAQLQFLHVLGEGSASALQTSCFCCGILLMLFICQVSTARRSRHCDGMFTGACYSLLGAAKRLVSAKQPAFADEDSSRRQIAAEMRAG